MDNISQHIEQQHEGQEHEFLDYQYVDINFIYSFTWDTTLVTWEDLSNELVGVKGWKLRPLHERVVQDEVIQLNSNYQPNLVFKIEVLERTSQILKKGILRLPIERDSHGKPHKFEEVPIDLLHTVRIFDNGGATCTFSVCLRGDVASFRNIHAVLRLTHNIDLKNNMKKVSKDLPITESFLQVPKSRTGTGRLDHSLFPFGTTLCSLHDLFRSFMASPPPWAPMRAKKLWDESDVLTINQDQDFQSPFVFTVAQVNRESFWQFCKESARTHSREVASIFCKLTLDNRFIEKDYENLSRNYLEQFLSYDHVRDHLLNLCLDDRLFFSMSRRGAIALTYDLRGIPSCFVVPSFLNLCEILRARWHISNIVSARLDKAIYEIGSKLDLDPLELMQNMFKWRMMFAAFLRDPVPFLFDGGSVTEIAEIAEDQLWLRRLQDETSRKLEILDQLVRDYLNIERYRRLRDVDLSKSTS